MFKDISYKKKCIGLLVILPLVLILMYVKSFSKTVEARKMLREQSERLSQINNAQLDYVSLKNDVQNLDAVIGKSVASPDIVQQEIFDIFTKIPFQASIEKLEETHKSEDTYFNIFTNNIIFKGGFNNLLETTYFYERNFQYSRVVSLSFFIKKDYKKRSKTLFEQVIFQNYEKK